MDWEEPEHVLGTMLPAQPSPEEPHDEGFGGLTTSGPMTSGGTPRAVDNSQGPLEIELGAAKRDLLPSSLQEEPLCPRHAARPSSS